MEQIYWILNKFIELEGELRMNSNNYINYNVYDEDWLEGQISSLGKNIREERLKRDLSLKDLSLITNINKRQLYKIESGENKIGLKGVLRIMIALEIQPNKLFEQII